MLQKKYAIGRSFGPASFYAQALKIAIPVMAQMLIQNLVSLIDNFMVAGLGDVKMSGVNICGQIIFVCMVFMNTICMAGGIFMTQFSRLESDHIIHHLHHKPGSKIVISSSSSFHMDYRMLRQIHPTDTLQVYIFDNPDP